MLVGGPAAVWTSIVGTLRDLGAADVLVVGTDGLGAGPQPDAQVVAVEIPDDVGPMQRLRTAIARVADPPPPSSRPSRRSTRDRTAVVFGTFLTESPTLVGRPLVAHRRPEWVALEDKTTVDALLDRAGVARSPSITVDDRRSSGDLAAVRPRRGQRVGGRRPRRLPRWWRRHPLGDRRRRCGSRDRRVRAPSGIACGSCRSSTASPRRSTASCCPTASSPCGRSRW